MSLTLLGSVTFDPIVWEGRGAEGKSHSSKITRSWYIWMLMLFTGPGLSRKTAMRGEPGSEFLHRCSLLTSQVLANSACWPSESQSLPSIAVIRFIYPFTQYHPLCQIVIVGGPAEKFRKNIQHTILRIDFNAIQPFKGTLPVCHPSLIHVPLTYSNASAEGNATDACHVSEK